MWISYSIGSWMISLCRIGSSRTAGACLPRTDFRRCSRYGRCHSRRPSLQAVLHGHGCKKNEFGIWRATIVFKSQLVREDVFIEFLPFLQVGHRTMEGTLDALLIGKYDERRMREVMTRSHRRLVDDVDGDILLHDGRFADIVKGSVRTAFLKYRSKIVCFWMRILCILFEEDAVIFRKTLDGILKSGVEVVFLVIFRNRKFLIDNVAKGCIRSRALKGALDFFWRQHIVWIWGDRNLEIEGNVVMLIGCTELLCNLFSDFVEDGLIALILIGRCHSILIDGGCHREISFRNDRKASIAVGLWKLICGYLAAASFCGAAAWMALLYMIDPTCGSSLFLSCSTSFFSSVLVYFV